MGQAKWKEAHKADKKKLVLITVIAFAAVLVAASAVFANSMLRTPEIVYLQIRDDIQVAVGDTATVDFVTGTSGEENEKLVTRAVSKLGLEWTVGDEDIAYYDSGLVLGRKEGVTTLNVKSPDGKFDSTCQVTVTTAEEAE